MNKEATPIVDELVEMLQSLKQSAIGMNYRSTENTPLSVGESKLGGRPDVPAGFEWPVDDSNRPLSLLLQLNCADLTPHDPQGLLPSSGHLYFFYELGEQDWEGLGNSVRVLYTEHPCSELHPAEYPDTLEDSFRLNEKALTFYTHDSYPSFEDINEQNPAYDRIMDHCDEFYDARDKVMSETDATPTASMLGYANLIQNCIVEDLNENVLLLQLPSIESEESDELLFGDCGTLYFYISREDLENRHFDRIKFEMQCY